MDNVQLILIPIIFNFIIFLVQKIIDKKSIKTEVKKKVSEIKKIDSDTLAVLTKSIDELTTNYVSTNEKYIESSKKINNLSAEAETNRVEIEKLNQRMVILDAENNELKTKNSVFESAIFELQRENFNLKKESVLLRSLVEYERAEGIKLRKGIDKLINQLRSVPLSPIWEPPTTPIDEQK